MGVPAWMKRSWQAVSGVATLVTVSQWPVATTLTAVIGGLGGALVSWLGSVAVWAWFLLVIAGVGGALFIRNEWRRGSRRQNQPVQDTPTLGDSRMSDNIAEYLWVMLRPVDLQGVGVDPGDRDFAVFRLRIASALEYPVRFTRIEAELKLNGAATGVWNEFRTARRAFLPNRLWRGDERVVFVGSDLRRLVEAGVRRSSVSLDVRVTLDSGEVLYLRNVNEEPHRGHVVVEDD